MPYKDPEERRAYFKAYNAAHRDERRAYGKAYSETHRDEKQAYGAAHKEETRARNKAYAEKMRSDEQFRNAANERGRKWYAENRASCHAADLIWRAKNPDKVKAKIARSRLNSPSLKPEYSRLRYKNDADYRARRILNASNQSARRKGAPGEFTPEDIQKIWERQKNKCAVPDCTNPIAASGKNKFHIDHIQALANGGSNWPDNLQILCAKHNISKNAQDEHEWAQSHGMLFAK